MLQNTRSPQKVFSLLSVSILLEQLIRVYKKDFTSKQCSKIFWKTLIYYTLSGKRRKDNNLRGNLKTCGILSFVKWFFKAQNKDGLKILKIDRTEIVWSGFTT